jgi:hypothetical protein
MEPKDRTSIPDNEDTAQIEPACRHCKNQHICRVWEKAQDLLTAASKVMRKSNYLYVKLTEGIAEECDHWDAMD